MEKFKGRKAYVLKGEHDCTLNGVSSKFDEFVVIGEGIAQQTEGNEDGSNVLRIVKRRLFGEDYYHAEPVNKKAGKVGPMFGGNYINTVGSMFNGLKYPIAIHDRFETPQQYKTLST